MSLLFSPYTLRSVTLRNRIVMSPMCMYSAVHGHVSDWHLVHYPTRSVGGVGMVVVEATAVEPRGVISPADLGIWSDDHLPGLARLATLIERFGAVAAVQLAHAGRKAGGYVPEGYQDTVQDVVAPSPIPFNDKRPTPRELSHAEMAQIRQSFAAGARRAVAAGFAAIELHVAHGYLLFSFLSPLSNHRTDYYGGSVQNRMRYPIEVIDAVREAIGPTMPLLVRISSIDPEGHGWTPDDTVTFAAAIRRHGVDLLDCSAGGSTPEGRLRPGPGYQVPYAEKVKRETEMPTGAVGVITEPRQAEQILQQGRADLIFLGRELLRNPYWPLQAMLSLEPDSYQWPTPYKRAVP